MKHKKMVSGMDLEEGDRLRWEVLELLSELNTLHILRLIRLFDRYRWLRHRFCEFFLRAKAYIRTRLSPRRNDSRVELLETCLIDSYDVLLFSNGDWRWRYQRPQHLANQWAENEHRVFFIVPEFRPQYNPQYNTYPPKPYLARSIQENILEVFLAGPLELNPLGKGLLENEAGVLLSSLGILQHDHNIKKAVCFLESPFWGPLALRAGKNFGWKVVYDCLDRLYGVHPSSHSMIASEIELIHHADLVIATAHQIVDDVLSLGIEPCLVPNAADMNHFSGHENTDFLREKIGTSSPVIGYVGAMNRWFDAEMIAHVAIRHPEWSFVLVGSGDQVITPLKKCPNIHFFGEIPYEQVPGFVTGFDVCIIPFKTLPVVAATDPVKFYEYLAMGKPVVATNLSELGHYPEFAYQAANAMEFEQAIQRALAEDNAVMHSKRIRFAHENSWSKRFSQLDIKLQKLFIVSGGITNEKREILKGQMTGPFIRNLHPPAIRTNRLKSVKGNDVQFTLSLTGQGFNPDCLVLLDEEPMQSTFIDDQHVRCALPKDIQGQPGGYMVSVMNPENGKQSNRRVFLVERI